MHGDVVRFVADVVNHEPALRSFTPHIERRLRAAARQDHIARPELAGCHASQRDGVAAAELDHRVAADVVSRRLDLWKVREPER